MYWPNTFTLLNSNASVHTQNINYNKSKNWSKILIRPNNKRSSSTKIIDCDINVYLPSCSASLCIYKSWGYHNRYPLSQNALSGQRWNQKVRLHIWEVQKDIYYTRRPMTFFCISALCKQSLCAAYKLTPYMLPNNHISTKNLS